MKILLLHNRYQHPGGEDEVFRAEAALLRAAGHEVVEHRRDNDGILLDGLVSRARLAAATVWSRGEAHALRARLRDEAPDVAHFHNTFPLISPAAYYACRDAGVPIVQTLHNYRLVCPAATLFREGRVCTECADHHLLRSVRHGCYRGSRPATAAVAAMIGVHRALATWRDKVDVYIALSEFARRTFVAAGLPAENVVVKPNFVAPDPGPRTGTGDYALFVGRLSPEKGLPTMLEAWRRLGTRVPLEIIGDGPERKALQMAAAGLAEVRFRGRLPREETLAAMKGARCLVFPSQWYEGLPMTIIEAFACGVPVIASRLGTMAEVVADGRTGIHFTPGDAADLAIRIDRAWSDPQAMEAMGAAARAEFESRYTMARNHEMLMSIYARAIATLARTARPSSTPCFDRGAST